VQDDPPILICKLPYFENIYLLYLRFEDERMVVIFFIPNTNSTNELTIDSLQLHPDFSPSNTVILPSEAVGDTQTGIKCFLNKGELVTNDQWITLAIVPTRTSFDRIEVTTDVNVCVAYFERDREESAGIADWVITTSPACGDE
jgi:hypothetical protein